MEDENWSKCKADDPDTSIAECTALIQSGQEPTNNLASAYFDRGIAYRDKKDLDSALQDLYEALQLKPNSPGAPNSRGNTYADKGDNDRAIADYTEAPVDVLPGTIDPHIGPVHRLPHIGAQFFSEVS